MHMHGLTVSGYMSVSVMPNNDAVMALGSDQDLSESLLAQLPVLEGITETCVLSGKL